MGYLIKTASEIVKIEVEITEAQFQSINTQGVDIFLGENARVFVPTVAFLQIYDTPGAVDYVGFGHLYLADNSFTNFAATFDATLLQVGKRFVNSFAINIKHPINIFGSNQVFQNDLLLMAASAPTAGSGDGKLTVYGYYVNKI
jgi:hypothetical protein